MNLATDAQKMKWFGEDPDHWPTIYSIQTPKTQKLPQKVSDGKKIICQLFMCIVVSMYIPVISQWWYATMTFASIQRSGYVIIYFPVNYGSDPRPYLNIFGTSRKSLLSNRLYPWLIFSSFLFVFFGVTTHTSTYKLILKSKELNKTVSVGQYTFISKIISLLKHSHGVINLTQVPTHLSTNRTSWAFDSRECP